jgi:hypothetical protein
MADERYMIEVKPLVYRLMDAVVKHGERTAGFSKEEIDRAVGDWLIQRRIPTLHEK